MPRDTENPRAALPSAAMPLARHLWIVLWIAALFLILSPPAHGAAGPPRYFNYSSPPGTGDDAGEPSIGINGTTERSFGNSVRIIPPMVGASRS